MNIPRHIKLAYLIGLVHKKILSGKTTNFWWTRQNKLVKELEKEDRLMNTEGFMINDRFIKKGMSK
jgi:hypothetical protein